MDKMLTIGSKDFLLSFSFDISNRGRPWSNKMMIKKKIFADFNPSRSSLPSKTKRKKKGANSNQESYYNLLNIYLWYLLPQVST